MGSEDYVDIDTMLKHVGDFCKYQKILLSIFATINVFSAFHYFGQTFISVIPEYECKTAQVKYDYEVIDECTIIQHTINSTITTPCREGWYYNNHSTFGFLGIVQELNWVCSDNWKPALGQSFFFVGSVVGSLGFGILADKLGRLHALIFSNLLVFVGNMITILSGNIILFSISRFIAGCATDTNFVMIYIIVMEYIRPSLRTIGLNLCIGIFYCISCISVPWVAVALKNWRVFLAVISGPHVLVLLFYLWVPESAQWLVSKGKIDTALKCFAKIARINGRVYEEKMQHGLKLYCAEKLSVCKEHVSFLGLLKTPKLRRKTIILIFKSMVMTLCYDGISRNVNGLGFSPFLVFSITSSTILPACLLILWIQDRIGRKALASSSLFLTGVFTIIAGIILYLVENPNPYLILTLAVTTRFGINIAYNSGAQYAVELIPTVVRGQGVSVVHVAGYAASFFSPQILYLANIWKPYPETILGILLMLGAISCLFLPETLNKTLPVSLEDGENFGEDERIFDFPFFNYNKTESTQVLNVSNTNLRTTTNSANINLAPPDNRGVINYGAFPDYPIHSHLHRIDPKQRPINYEPDIA